MGLQIKHWITGAVLYEHDGDDLREAVETAVAKGICLDGANLDGAILDFARLNGARLNGARLVGAMLGRASLIGARLVGAILDDASLIGAILDGAILDGASLNGASLDGAILDGASLNGASLVGASLDGASLDGACFVGARFDGEILEIAPISITGLAWLVLITPAYMRVGCKRHTHDQWAAFLDLDISAMDRYAMAFWSTWKAPLLAMCAAHRAEHYKALEAKQ